jgi:hypothetical protein
MLYDEEYKQRREEKRHGTLTTTSGHSKMTGVNAEF